MALPTSSYMKSSFRFGINSLRKRLCAFPLRRNFGTQADEAKLEPEKSEDTKNDCKRKQIKIITGKYAGLADGCAVAEYGGSAVMATAVGTGQPDGMDINLTVNYVQKAAAIGRIPTNFIKRDLGHSDYEILISRVIDRSLRPMFEPGHTIETQVMCHPLALDGENFPEPLAINAASAALALSDIPWNGPVAAVRVALIDNEIVFNPTKLELNNSSINMIVTSTNNNCVVMIEGFFNNSLLNDINLCLRRAVNYSKVTLEKIRLLREASGKEKREITPIVIPDEINEFIRTESVESLNEILTDYTYDKRSRDQKLKGLFEKVQEKIQADFPDVSPKVISAAWYKIFKETYREVFKTTGKRCDGRSQHQIRKITSEMGIYGSLHGSAMFKRGQTQVFCTVALDSPNSVLRMDKISMLISGVTQKNFFLHYNFPPYATGETGRIIMKNRREIGHGNLAEKALIPAIPEVFPFTIRLTSEVFESNGSSSMATVCGGTLALADAGVEIQYPIAGVAMGLLSSPDRNVETSSILTDIMGMEDYLGDMDLKIAGTAKGFTAIQLDIKIPGMPVSLLQASFLQGKKALRDVLQSMNSTLQKFKSHPKEKEWPVIEEIRMPQYLRSTLFGFGGARVKKFELDVGVEVMNFEEDKLSIFAPNKAAMDEAKAYLEKFMEKEKPIELEFGGVYTATVTEIKNNGCLVSLHESLPAAFISLSQLSNRKVSHPSALGIEVGSKFQVKYFGRDPVSGVLRLSRKILLGRDESF